MRPFWEPLLQMICCLPFVHGFWDLFENLCYRWFIVYPLCMVFENLSIDYLLFTLCAWFLRPFWEPLTDFFLLMIYWEPLWEPLTGFFLLMIYWEPLWEPLMGFFLLMIYWDCVYVLSHHPLYHVITPQPPTYTHISIFMWIMCKYTYREMSDISGNE